jgi:hypothetical protein
MFLAAVLEPQPSVPAPTPKRSQKTEQG